MTIFVDSSIWFAAVVGKDRNNERARIILKDAGDRVTSDLVVAETWLLFKSRGRRDMADRIVDEIMDGGARIVFATQDDLVKSRAIRLAFPDQSFSFIDRTSFAIMERLGLTRVASLDDDFVIYRFGGRRERAFEVLR